MIVERDDFDVEVIAEGTGDIMIYVSVEGSDGSENARTILSKDELKKMIDDLQKIYEEVS